MYDCQSCDFSSKYLNDYRRHLKSKKHLSKCNDTKTCYKCLKNYSNIGNLNKHLKSCKIDLCSKKITINSENNNGVVSIGDNNNNININIDNLNINIPNLENVSEEYRKYYMMTLPELLEKSISDFVSKEMNRQLLHEKCDFMQFAHYFTSDILVQHCIQYGSNSCAKCIRKNGTNDRKDTIIEYCNEHKLTHKDAIRVLIKNLTRNHKKNICITSLKKYDNDDGRILIKHKDLLFSLGILNSFLEQCTHSNLINFDKDVEIDQQDVLDLYEAFFKNFEKSVIANKNKFNRR